jgi:TolB-like protein/class 3 adenylate cyclase
MADERIQRRLAAILAADVVGYSRLMEDNEAETLSLLKRRRNEVLSPLIAAHQGRLIKVMGDGVLVEFASAVNAVECALALQKEMMEANAALPEARHVVLRIGINLGDVIVEGSDLYGDGVNVAARLESLAEPGQVLVSGNVYEQVKRKLISSFDELGPRSVKNISDPVQVYRVRPVAKVNESATAEADVLELPAIPSIAVLPFTNMSSDPEHEFFADGLTEDLITDLSQAQGLFVIARNSSFAYKGKSIDVRSIARDLGVRYVLEGSARRSGERVRINVQLIDALKGGHVWAERFDRSLGDIFALQDEVAARIIESLVGRLVRGPQHERKRATNLGAYDLCVRGRGLVLNSPEASREARLLFKQAIELDPGFSEAHRWLALSYDLGWAFLGESKEPNHSLSLAAARRAIELDPNDAGAHAMLGTLLQRDRRWEEVESEFAIALKLDSNNAYSWAMLSEFKVLKGEAAEAIAAIDKAMRLNPLPPAWYHWFLGQAYYLDRQYEKAVSVLRREKTYGTESQRTLAAALAQLGRLDEARREAKLYLTRTPTFTISHWTEWMVFQNEVAGQHFVDGYRKAGLPE